MKTKTTLTMILLSVATSLFAGIVARVDNNDITSQEFKKHFFENYNLYKQHPEQFPQVSLYDWKKDLRKYTLNQLIEDKLYQKYAKQHNIKVSNTEAERYFYQTFVDDSNFMKNGKFSRKKLEEFKSKNPDKYLNILKKIKQDLLHFKIEQVIKNQFTITDQQLIDLYIKQNAQIKLNYAIIPDSLMPVDFIPNLDEVRDYYYNHQYQFYSPEKVSIRVLFIKDKDFLPQIKISEQMLRDYYFSLRIERDYFTIKHSLQESLKNILAHKEAKKEADRVLSYLKIGYKKDEIYNKYTMYELPYFAKGERIGQLPRSEEIIEQALQLDISQYCKEPFDLSDRFVIFQVMDIIPPQKQSLAEAGNKVWKAYLMDYKSKAKRYFLHYVSEKLTDSLHQFTKIDRTEDYQPQFSDVEDDIIDSIKTEQEKKLESEYRSYYKKNKEKFHTKDSVKYAVIFVPKNLKDITVSDSTIEDFYQKHKEQFFQSKQALFQTIFISKYKGIEKREDAKEIANKVTRLAKHRLSNCRTNARLNGSDFNDLAILFSDREIINQRDLTYQTIAYLPGGLRDSIYKMDKGIAGPIETNEGFYIIKLIDIKDACLSPFAEVKEQIRQKLTRIKADEQALEKIKEIDSKFTVYNSSLAELYPHFYFQTDWIDFEQEIKNIGSLASYKSELSKLKTGKKLPAIIKSDTGYGIVFLLDRKKGEQLTYGQALSIVKQEYNELKQLERNKELSQQIISRIRQGDNPDSLLLYFSGWHSTDWLKLDDIIPGFNIEESRIILENTLNRKPGSFSHLFRIRNQGFAFYQVKDVKTVSREKFEQEKEELRRQYIEQKYQQWYEKYKGMANVEIYIDN